MTAVRTELDRTFRERITHRSVEDLRKTRSLASAEQQFREDYSGRFLIELLQNARDAYRAKEPEKRRLTVFIRRTHDALLVANAGVPLDVNVLLGSLTQIGASTKPAGDAIGHKGIGFKSVLEVSETPELFSGRTPGGFALAVRFDRAHALQAIVEQVGPEKWRQWHERLTEANRDPAHLPILYFPRPFYEGDLRARADHDLAAVAAELGADFDTVVRLPISPERSELVHRRIGDALRALDTPILMLLGCLERLVVVDEVEPELSEDTIVADDHTVATISDRDVAGRRGRRV